MNQEHLSTIIQQQLQLFFTRFSPAVSVRQHITTLGARLEITLIFGFPITSYADGLHAQLLAVIQAAYPDVEVHLALQTNIPAYLTQMPGQSLRGVKNIIAVASGKGGVGKSTVAVNLAIAMAQLGARVGLLDADIYGPSIPLMLGPVSAMRFEQDKVLPIEKYGIQAMSIGYLAQHEKPLIWRGPMLAKSLIQMLNITAWDGLDYLVVDLPPGTGDIQLSLVQKIPLAGAIIVTTPQPLATIDAEKALQMFRTTHIDVLGLVENMSQHSCSQCGHTEAIFSGDGVTQLSQQYVCPIFAKLPLDKALGQHCDEGLPSSARGPGPLHGLFTQLALDIALELSKKQVNYADKFPPIIVDRA